MYIWLEGLVVGFCVLSNGAETLLENICKAKKLGKDPAQIVWKLLQIKGKYSEYSDLISSELRAAIRELEDAEYITTQWARNTLTSLLINASIETYHEKLKEFKQQQSPDAGCVISRILGFFKR